MSGKRRDQKAIKLAYEEPSDLWTDLSSLLTVDEGHALYHAMKETTYRGGQAIFTQGKKNSNLYLVKQGQLRMHYSKGGSEIFLKMLRPGDVIGEDTFFSDSVCTTSVTPFSHARLIYLEKDTLLQWENVFPGLEQKLHNYCLKFGKVSDLLAKKCLDRRTENRFKVCGKVVLQVLSIYGSTIGKAFEGDIYDISAGGMACFIRLSKKKNAQFLLGCDLRMEFTIPTRETIWKMGQIGTIVSVRCNPLERYSLHVKFHSALDATFMEEIERFTVAPSLMDL